MAVTSLSFLPHSNLWWGIDLLHFYPAPFRLWWAAVALIGLFAAWWIGARVRVRSVDIPAAFVALGAAFLSGIVFHFLRERTGLMGRGTSIVIDLRQGRPPAPESPVFNRLEPILTEWFRGMRSTPTLDEAGRISVWIGAVAIGLAASLLLRRSRTKADGVSASIGAIVLLQASMQLFFGHVDAWALTGAACLLFLLAAQAALEGITPLWPCALAAVVAIASHPLGWIVAPAFISVLWVKRSKNTRRPGTPATAGPSPIPSALLAVVVAGFAGVMALVRRSGPAFAELALRPSSSALVDTLNTVWLLSAPALIAIIAMAATPDGRKRLASPLLVPGVLMFVPFLASRLFMTTILGASRDWDFFSVTGIALTAIAAAALGGNETQDSGRPVAGPVQFAIVSLFFLVPWIGLQADSQRSTAHHLAMIDARPPLAPKVRASFHGAMGDRFVYLGNTKLAAAAYEQAWSASPDPRYSWRSGLCYLNSGLLENAAAAFRATTRQDPLDWQAWSELGNALCGMNQLDKSEDALRRAILLNANVAEPRIHLARTLAQQGRDRDARAMLESARPLLRHDRAMQNQFELLDSHLSQRMSPG